MDRLTIKLKWVQAMVPCFNPGLRVLGHAFQLQADGMSPDDCQVYKAMLPPELQPRCVQQHFRNENGNTEVLKLFITLGEKPGTYASEFGICMRTLEKMGFVEVDTKLVEEGQERYQVWHYQKSRKRKLEKLNKEEEGSKKRANRK